MIGRHSGLPCLNNGLLDINVIKFKIMNRRLIILCIWAMVGSLSACQEDHTILPDLGILPSNDMNVSGGGSFDFTYTPLQTRPIKVWYFVPEDKPQDTPIVFIMHGVDRNGDVYRNQWVNLAKENKWIIIAPNFSDTDWPGSRYYNVGNVFDGSGGYQGNLNPEADWTFSSIEAIFDHVVSEIDGNQTSYNIYGHSAGSQFVHRMVTLKSEPLRAKKIIVANAGWYTLLDENTPYPFGIRNLELSEEQINRALALDMVVLLGEADVLIDDNLNTDPQAMLQGPYRFARGQNYYNYHRDLAAKRGVPFGWTLSTVPGVGHNNRNMAPAAAEFLK